MYTLKSLARRGIPFTAAVALAVSAVVPALLPGHAYADALNPLTDRSLTLSSSAPGWDFTDGSGNTTYAPPNSGANGKKTGNYFDFKVSTNSTDSGEHATSEPIKTMTFQYCTTSAGLCQSPGDNGYTGTTRNADSTTTSDLNVVTSTPTEIGSSDFSTLFNTDGTLKQTPQGDIAQLSDNTVAGNFIVLSNETGTWAPSSGWSMSTLNVEDGTIGDGTATGAQNYIILTNDTGLGIPSGTEVKVMFFATDNNYITNPGSGAFFVKINTYKVEYDGNIVDIDSLAPASDENVIDGGVTVANVMNHSIRIQTKVLETMDFSVGTVDPNTLDDDTLSTATGGNKTSHAPCDPILSGMLPNKDVNVLRMGNQAGEDSLSTTVTYSTHSFWRLSSNSSAGATVYYSGSTLSNTVGDQIDPIYDATEGDGKAAYPQPGMEQFGLALTTQGSANDYKVDYKVERSTILDDGSGGKMSKLYENGADNSTYTYTDVDSSTQTDGLTKGGVDASTTSEIGSNGSWHDPKLAPLVPEADYANGAGTVNANFNNSGSDPISAKFAFNADSMIIPVPIASEDQQVVDCVTGRMRYIANIASTTPAGIYTTAINYIAAPQY